MIIKNKTKKTWPVDSIRFKNNEDNSTIICKYENIIYPCYEIAPKQDGDFIFIFDENIPIGDYECFFDVFEGKKIKDAKFELFIRVKE